MLTHTSLSARPHRFTRASERVRLIVIDGPDRGLELSVGAELVRIGSAPDADLVLTDPSVSRQHAEVRWDRQALVVVDRASRNGSFVAGCRIREAELPAGTELRIGTTTVKAIPADEDLEPAISEAERSGGLVATSKVMRQLFTLIDQLAASDVSILIEGETGVGKELVAEEVHRRSARRDRPFAVFDGSTTPDSLIEATLFGHARGAFPGADVERGGVFTDGDGGTVFLDEIGELGLDVQAALLRALDRRMVRPVGAPGYRSVDVRVIAATHRELGERIAGGLFREDLYYRLAVVRVAVPPLRERAEDIPLLVRHFLHGRSATVDAATMQRLIAYDWPGNVRELRNVIDGALALSRGDVLAIGELGPRAGAPPRRPRRESRTSRSARPRPQWSRPSSDAISKT